MRLPPVTTETSSGEKAMKRDFTAVIHFVFTRTCFETDLRGNRGKGSD